MFRRVRVLAGQKRNISFYFDRPAKQTGQTERVIEPSEQQIEEQHPGQTDSTDSQKNIRQFRQKVRGQDRQKSTQKNRQHPPQNNSLDMARRVVHCLGPHHIDVLLKMGGALYGHSLPEGAWTHTTGVQYALLRTHVATRVWHCGIYSAPHT